MTQLYINHQQIHAPLGDKKIQDSEVVSLTKSFIIEVNNRVLRYLNIFKVSGFKTEYKYNPPQKNLYKKRGVMQCF